MIVAEAPIEVFEEIDSTILEARRRAERAEFGPVWLVARRQSAGRGRRGRPWVSYEGNLLATLLFSTPHPPATIALLGFATGLALAEAMDAVIEPARTTLKWPNDLFIDGAKAAGIMLDSGAREPGATWVALAFGVNLAVAPEAIDQPTISLRQASQLQAPEPLDFLANVQPRLAAWAARLEHEGFAPLREAWIARAHGLGRAVRVMQGETALEGRIAGLSPRGELELDTSSGPRLIAAGDVIFSNGA
jgi:BirA family biotin operon repressor/biotin-[acetyl-CoA-carboxylase] ligase